MYAVEHGPERDDEINLLVPGGNYGWPCYTGAGNAHNSFGGPCVAVAVLSSRERIGSS